MKNNYKLLAGTLILFFISSFVTSLKSQDLQPSNIYSPSAITELDAFLYAATENGAYYDFHVTNVRTGEEYTIRKDRNYFSLNELSGNPITYNTDCIIRTRYITTSGNISPWGEQINIRTPEARSYNYGYLRLQFHESEYVKYMSFLRNDSIIQNNEMPGFNEIARTAGIKEVRYPAIKYMQLIGRNPYSFIDLVFDDKFSVDSLISFFEGADYLEFTEPHYTGEYTEAPSEYGINIDSNGDGIPDFWHLTDISSVETWNMVDDQNMSNAIIAVLDNVFYLDHEDLRANIYVNMGEIPEGLLTDQNQNGFIDAEDLLYYYNTTLGYNYSGLKELFTSPPANDLIFNGIDDDGNGYTDDICGWDNADLDNDVMPFAVVGDLVSHGTHVAGIAGAVSGNGGICSLNKNVRILPVKLSFDNPDGGGYVQNNMSNVVNALNYILSLEEKPNVITMSFGQGEKIRYFGEMLELLDETFNVTSFGSTGNSGRLLNYDNDSARYYPAMYDNVISVGSTSLNNYRSLFSNYGDIRNTYVLAPGENIYSSISEDISQSLYDTQTGTSMSTPLAASLASLLYSYYPSITPGQVRQAIECGCNNNSNQVNHYNFQNDGFGKINAYETLNCLRSLVAGVDIRSEVGSYCPEAEYTFEGIVFASTGNNLYRWTVTGGSYTISGGNNNRNLNIVFHEIGNYTISLSVTNDNGTSEYSINIETSYPQLIIRGGNNLQVLQGYNSSLFMEFTGQPPFNLSYYLDNELFTIDNINSFSYVLNIPTEAFDGGTTHIFSINSFGDAACGGYYDTEEINFTVDEFPIPCSGKYNNVMHFNSVYANPLDPSYGLYFTPTPQPVANPIDPYISSHEGTASVCDFDGNPILSASGGYIYSTGRGCFNSLITPNPVIPYSEISSSAQGHLILPNPSDPYKYNIFMIPQERVANPRLVWGTVDFTNSICGEYIHGGEFTNNDVEKLAACRISGIEKGYWILTHSEGSHKFNIYKILDSDGILTYEGSQLITPELPNNIERGEMKFNLAMDMLAVAFSSSRRIELYRFYRNAGHSGNRLELIDYRLTDAAPYSLEFSPDGNLLYVVEGGQIIMQFNTENFSQQEPVLFNYPSGDMGAAGLALGPDMKIYVNTRPTISVILSPNSIGNNCNLVTDIFQCNLFHNFPPRIPLIENDLILNYSTENCNPKITILNAAGSAPFTYLWDTGETTPEINISEAGTYQVNVTSANGCSATGSITISEDDILIPLQVRLIQSGNTCEDENNGFINVSVTGGIPPYSSHWENSGGDVFDNSPFISNLYAGNYFLIVSDNAGCTATMQHQVNILESPQIEIINIIPECRSTSPGSAEVNILNSTGTYTYRWSNGERTRIAVRLREGTHTVTVTNDGGCTTTGEVYIPNISLLSGIGHSNDCKVINDEDFYFYPANIPEEDWGNYTFSWRLFHREVATSPEYYPYFTEDGYHSLELEVTSTNCSSSEQEIIYVYPSECYCETHYDYESVTINTNRTWSTPVYYIKDTLRVKSRYTLTLNNTTLRFSPSGILIVEPGGQLICRNSVLTSFEDGSCNHMWQGVEVWGNPHMSDNENYQGTFRFQDFENGIQESGIKNAYIGILFGARRRDVLYELGSNRNASIVSYLNMGGGRLFGQANKRINFTDNGIHIKMLKKTSENNSSDLKSYSFSSGRLLDDRYHLFHVRKYNGNNYRNIWAKGANTAQRSPVCIEIEGVKDFTIYECSFYNAEIFIKTIDAKYNVTASHFNRGMAGIQINNSNSEADNRHDISQCTFDNIPYDYISENIPNPGNPVMSRIIPAHIYISGGKYDYIHDNRFGDQTASQQNNQTGIHIRSSSSFNITENDFMRIQTGIFVYGSGNTGGYIGAGESLDPIYTWQGNIFTSCRTSILTAYNNPWLKLKCNISNNYDSYLYSENYNNTGALANQGQSTDRADAYRAKRGAGNEFHGDIPGSRKVLSSGNAYTYHHHSSPIEAIPDVSFSRVNIYANNTGVAKNNNNAYSCKPVPIIYSDETPNHEFPVRTYMPVVDFGINKEAYYYVLDSISKEISNLEALYEKIMSNSNNGYTDELLEEIYYGKPEPKLFNIYSPLPDTVLIALLVEYPFAGSDFYNIMKLNLPVSSNVEPYMSARLNTLNSWVVDSIKTLQAYNYHNPGTPNSLQNSINILKTERQLFFNNIISSLNEDPKAYKNDIIELLQNENNFEAKQSLVSTYLSDNRYAEATSVLSGMEPGTIEDKEWMEYTVFLLNLKEKGRNFYELQSSELDYLRELAEACPAGLATVNAQSILAFYYNEYFEECADKVAVTKSLGKKDRITLTAIEDNAWLRDNYPNPFTDETHIEYYFPEGNGKITIYDVFGKEMVSYNAVPGENILKINSSNWQPGVYIYGLIVNGEVVGYKKMILTK